MPTMLRSRRWVAGLMAFEAATLVLMSALHLGGVLDEGSDRFDPTHAGFAEAIIALVLAAGAAAWARFGARACVRDS
jgi:hypothetical protein